MFNYDKIILVHNYDEYIPSIEKYFNTKVYRDYGGPYIIDKDTDMRVDIQSVNSNQAISMLTGCIYNNVVIIDSKRIDEQLLKRVLNTISMSNGDTKIIEFEKHPEFIKLINNDTNDDEVKKPKSKKIEVKKGGTKESKQKSGIQKTTNKQ